MKKLLIAVLALGMMLGMNPAYAGEATDAIIGTAEAVTAGVVQVSDAVSTVVSSTEVQESLVGAGGSLEDILKSMITSAVAAKDFLVKEVPEVVTQLLWWHGLQSALSLLGMTFSLFVAPVLVWKICKHIEPNQARWDGLIGLLIVGVGLSLFMSGIIYCNNNLLDWLKILVAPKLYLIEYAAELIK